MANHRMAASTGAPNPFTVPWTTRTYTCVSGSYLDVPYPDSAILANAGWTRLGPGNCEVGPTTSRPSNPSIDQMFTDTTLNIMVVSDGQGHWLNAVTGAVS